MFDRIDEGRWWQFGWQLVEGCTKVSPGCKNCWSLAKEKRFRKETGVVFHEERLERPLKRKKPTSYSIWNDLFHEGISYGDIEKAIKVIEQCPQHTFQILTKRPHIMLEYFNSLGKRFELSCCQNVWLGVTAENQEQADKRIPILLQIPAAVRFVSVEPMLEFVDLKLDGCLYENYGIGDCYGACNECDTPTAELDWVICGCESLPGGKAGRPMDLEWTDVLMHQCTNVGTAFFMKQTEINGKVCKDITQFPKELQVREFPNG